jgi:hypothetical protein
MDHKLIVVDGYAATPADDTNLKQDVWSFALDQRAFGPRRLVVGFTDRSGRLRTLAHAPRTDPPEAALDACIQHLGSGAAAAVAWCDEEVVDGPPPVPLALTFALARFVAARHGVHLVDWISCDDSLFRSTRLALDPHGEWWDVPPASRSPGPRPRPRSGAGWVPRKSVRRRR